MYILLRRQLLQICLCGLLQCCSTIALHVSCRTSLKALSDMHMPRQLHYDTELQPQLVKQAANTLPLRGTKRQGEERIVREPDHARR